MGFAIILMVLGAVSLCQGRIADKAYSAKESKIVNRIIDGQVAILGQFPHQVYMDLMYFNGTMRYCGGSLIHPRWVLSAAHCIIDISVIYVLLGEVDRLAQGVHQITRVYYVNPEYDTENFAKNDLTMIDLGRSVNFTDEIRAIRLPTVGAPDFTGKLCTMSGWGELGRFQDSPQFLYYVELLVITNAQCNVKWYPWTTIESSLCARGQDSEIANPARGDSGGPLTCADEDGPVLAGVFSALENFYCPGFPTIYVRPQYFLDWIHHLIGF